jgi:hypothetical protein
LYLVSPDDPTCMRFTTSITFSAQYRLHFNIHLILNYTDVVSTISAIIIYIPSSRWGEVVCIHLPAPSSFRTTRLGSKD